MGGGLVSGSNTTNWSSEPVRKVGFFPGSAPGKRAEVRTASWGGSKRWPCSAIRTQSLSDAFPDEDA